MFSWLVQMMMPALYSKSQPSSLPRPVGSPSPSLRVKFFHRSQRGPKSLSRRVSFHAPSIGRLFLSFLSEVAVGYSEGFDVS